MKRFAIALAIGAVVVATSGTAYAQCVEIVANLSWDGGGGTGDWFTEANWNAADYPGKDGDNRGASLGDSAALACGTQPSITVNQAIPCDINTLAVDADTAGVPVTLTIVNPGSLTTRGMVTVAGDTASVMADRFAKIVFTSGTFAPYQMTLSGRDHSSRGHAVLDFDASVTVAGGTGTDTSFAGYCDVELAPNITFTAQEVYLEAGSDVTVSHTAAGGGTLQATTLTVDNATLQVSNATISTQ